MAALANFVPWWLAAPLGAVAGGGGFVGAVVWDRGVATRATMQAWSAATSTGPTSAALNPHLLLDAPERGLLAALNPDAEIVPFHVAREVDLSPLLDWCRNDGRQGWIWGLSGEAGEGKTRLLVQAIARLRKDGWICGWVRRRQAAAAVDAAARWDRPVLLVVDDAETRDDLVELATALADLHNRNVRALVAAREFNPWWGNLRAALAPDVAATLPHPASTVLGPVAATAPEQLQLFAEAVECYSRHFGLPVPTASLAGPAPSMPLGLIHAAAAVAAHDSLSVPITIEAALYRLFQIEEDWWEKRAVAQGIALPPAVLRSVVTTAVLVGATDKAQAIRRLRCLPGLATCSDALLDDVANWVRELYVQRTGDWLDPHLPARLAERYAVAQLSADPGLPAAVAAAALTP